MDAAQRRKRDILELAQAQNFDELPEVLKKQWLELKDLRDDRTIWQRIVDHPKFTWITLIFIFMN